MVKRLMLLAPPGAGKGTQASILCQKYSIPHISTGDMLRSEIAQKTEIGQKVESILEAGELVGDDLIIQMISERLQKPDCQNGYLFDGFPRTIAQAAVLRDNQINIDFVIELQIDDETIIERMTGRRIHMASGRTYHVTYNPSKREGLDDETGEPIIQREDDNEETVRHRISVFKETTSQLISFYQQWSNSGLENAPQFCQVSAIGTVEEVSQRLIDSLKNG